MGYKFNAITGQLDLSSDGASPTDVSDLVTLTGVPVNSTDLGTFTGSIITNNDTIKEALQELETAIESLPDPIVYQGTWNATTNTPTLANTDTGKLGFLYQVTVAGSVDFGAGSISFEVGDKVVNNGSTWEKWDMTDAVASVNGHTGIVVLDSTDIAISGSTFNKALVSSGTGFVIESAVTATELGYVSGVTSAIQTQLNAKQSSTLTDGHILVGNASNVATDVAVTGDVTITNLGVVAIATGVIVNADINASAAIDASKIADGSVSSAEFQYLGGVTSDIQTQLDGMFKLAGRSGGQTANGGTAASENLILSSTAHATKGSITLGQTYKEFSTGGVRIGDISAADPTTLNGTIALTPTSSDPNILLIHNSGQQWILNPNTSTLQFNRQADDVVGFGLDTSSRFFTGDGAPLYTASFSNAGSSVTDITSPTAGNVTPLVGIRNRNNTVNNYTGLVFENQATATVAGIFGVNENHSSSGSQTGHLAFLTANAGTKARAMKIAADKIITMDAYGTGILHSDSSGVISSSTIVNADVSASAAIDASKIADGSVSSTEFQYLGGVTSDIQTQLGDKLPLAGGTMTGTITSQTIIPSAASTYNLGASGNNYLNVYANTVNAGIINRGSAGTLTIQTSSAASGININTIAGDISLNPSTLVINANSSKITNLANGTNPADAVNYSQISSLALAIAGDISQASFTAADNQAAAADVTGFAFANATVRSFDAIVSIVRGATYAQYKINGIQRAADWAMTQSYVGDDTGITFTITTAGQVQYTSTSTGSTGLLKIRAFVTSV